MELILISESKLKIMLTADDMEDYEISNELMTYACKDTRKMFGKILEEARAKTGFDCTSGKLFIQVYPSKNGGCEVYVTSDMEESAKEQPKAEKKTKEKSTQPKLKKEYCVFVFGIISDVVASCDILKKSGYQNESALYFEKIGENISKYYLVLQEEVPQYQQNRRKKAPTKCDLANEYGKRLENKESIFYIKEHAKCIVCKNAVEIMSKL